ncbi:MAG: hypothetical protein WD118_03655 [Phycisphaeraceae bacterium]
MTHVRKLIVPLMLILTVSLAGTGLWAQDRGERGPAERGERAQAERGQRGERAERGDRRERPSPEQMRERMEERRAAMAQRMQEQLGVNDDEWEAISPMVDRVRTLQMEDRAGGPGFAGRGRRGPGGFGGRAAEGEERELSPVAEASRDLRETLGNEAATERDIQQRIEALRAARAEHEQRLTEARDELRSVLSPRQEAMLIVAGLLD